MAERIAKEILDKAFDERFPQDMKEKLQNARVAVAGLGGLGSNIAVMLARSGVGHLFLVDFDVVDVPVIKGVKSANERFAGALETYTIDQIVNCRIRFSVHSNNELQQAIRYIDSIDNVEEVRRVLKPDNQQ